MYWGVWYIRTRWMFLYWTSWAPLKCCLYLLDIGLHSCSTWSSTSVFPSLLSSSKLSYPFHNCFSVWNTIVLYRFECTSECQTVAMIKLFWHFHVFTLAHNWKKCFQEASVLPKSVIEKRYLFFAPTFLLYHLERYAELLCNKRSCGRCSRYFFFFYYSLEILRISLVTSPTVLCKVKWQQGLFFYKSLGYV